jgi:hypothetical protein
MATPLPDRTFSYQSNAYPIYYRGPNETWRHTDKAGHEHIYDDRYSPLTGTCYPTLAVRTSHVDCGDEDCGCEGYDIEWYVCPRCGETIYPSQCDKVMYQAGYPSYAIDGMPVTAEVFRSQYVEYMAALAAAKEAKP